MAFCLRRNGGRLFLRLDRPETKEPFQRFFAFFPPPNDCPSHVFAFLFSRLVATLLSFRFTFIPRFPSTTSSQLHFPRTSIINLCQSVIHRRRNCSALMVRPLSTRPIENESLSAIVLSRIPGPFERKLRLRPERQFLHSDIWSFH